MAKFSFTSPNGEQYEIEGPEGSSREQAFSILQEGIKNGYYKPIAKQQDDSSYLGHVKKTLGGLGDVSVVGAIPGAAEALVGGIGDMANAAVSGIGGSVKSLFTGKSAADEIVNMQQSISNAIPYAPETESGKKIYAALGLIPEGIHALGEKTFEKTGSPLLATGVETLGNAAMFLPGLRKGKPKEAAKSVDDYLAQKKAEQVATAAKDLTANLKADKPATPWERTVNDLGETISPKETPFSGMVDTLSGNPRVVEPAFKMAPKETPYVKSTGEAARDDATVARLQAAVEKQNPSREPMMVTPEGQGVNPNDLGTLTAMRRQLEIERQHIEAQQQALAEQYKNQQNAVDALQQRLKLQQAQEAIVARQKALEQEVARRTSLAQNAAERQRQANAPTGYENWVYQQRQAAEQRLPGNNEPVNFTKETAPYSLGETPYQYQGGLDFTQHIAGDRQSPVIKAMQEKAAWEQRGKEQRAEQARMDALESKQQAQEGRLQPLEEQLRREAYSPPTQEDLRAGYLAGKSPRIGKFGQGGSAPILNDVADGIISVAKHAGNFFNKKRNVPQTKEQLLGMSPINSDLKEHIPPGPAVSDWINAAKTDPNDAGGFQNWKSGLTNEASKLNSTALQGAARWLNFGQKGGEYFVRSFVTPVEKKLRSLSSKEMTALNKLMKYEAETGSILTNTDIRNMGLSEKVLSAKVALRDAMDDVLRRTNEQLVADGKKPMTGEEFYYSSRWQGDWGAPVYTKDGTLAWWIKANSRADVAAQLKYLAKNHPELDINIKNPGIKNKFSEFAIGSYENGKRVGSIDIKNVNNPFSSKVPNDVLGTYKAMLEMLGDTPISKAIQESMQQYMKEQGFNYVGQSKHFENKAGIRGYLGDQPGLTDKQNAYNGMKSQVAYLKQAYNWLAMQESLKNVGEFLKDPELNQSHPGNMSLIKAYVNNEIGMGENITKPLEQTIAKTLGRSRANLYDVAGVLKGSAYLIQLGVNVGHVIGTVGSAITNTPYTLRMLSKEGYTLSPAKMSKAYTQALLDATTGVLQHTGNYVADTFNRHAPQVPMSDFGKQALRYMEDNGIISKTIWDEEGDLGAHVVPQTVVNTIGGTITAPEHIARSITFMSIANHIKESAVGKGMSLPEIFLKAEEKTNDALTGYNRADRPLIADKLGSAGVIAYTYKSYLFNLANTLNAMARQKDMIALGMLVGGLTLMGGVGNIPGVPELDGMNQMFRDWLAEDHPESFAKMKDFLPYGIKGEILGSNMPQWMRWGAASSITGAAVQSKFSPQFLDVEKPFEGLIGPAAVEAKEWAGIGNVLQHPDTHHLASAVHQAIAPPAFQGAMENTIDTFGQTQPNGDRTTFNPKDPFAVENQYTRTPKDQMYRYAGLRSLPEMETKTERYLVGRENKRIQTAQDTALKRMESAIVKDSGKEAGKFAALYFGKFEGEDSKFDKAIDAMAEKSKMTKEQYMAAHAETFHAIMNVKRMREMQNGSK